MNPQSLLRFSTFLLLLLCSSTNCNAWYQCPPIQQRLRSKHHQSGVFHTKTQIKSLPSSAVSFLTNNHQQTSKLMDINISSNASVSRNTRNDNNESDWKMIHGLRNIRLGRALLRTVSAKLILLVAALVFRPGSAVARTVQATAPAMAPAIAAPIITCPVSAATEFRLMIRLVVAALIGAVLGKERSLSKHSAGVRTMSLVSMGAAVFTVCSCYGFANFPKVDGT
jgi:hypothetical protein